MAFWHDLAAPAAVMAICARTRPQG
ncbi:hypothetical protein [Escherichia marmotae]|nr:hypothetical protein [Escherichia marmotae]